MKLAALALLPLVACRPVELRTVPTPVPVPCPEPPVLTWPALPTEQITPATPDGEVAKAYVATVFILRARLAEALALLDGYRTATPKTPIPAPGGKR